jgi:acyl-CoA synthetase (AMP-forming)/AMP-acid ligase II
VTSCVGSSLWRRTNPSSVYLAVAPLFHLLGLQNNVNSAIFWGGTIVLMPRWDREAAAVLIERHRVSFWAALPAMLVDFFAQPGIEARDLSSLTVVTGGDAATPQHVNDILKQRYGLDSSSSASSTPINIARRPFSDRSTTPGACCTTRRRARRRRSNPRAHAAMGSSGT